MLWIIADIHGSYAHLQKAIDKILEADKSPKFLFLGDYVNRGNDSRSVLDCLIDLDQKYSCIFLSGNHDDVFKYVIGLESYTDFRYFVDSPATPEKVKIWFTKHGLQKTLDNFPDGVSQKYKDFLSKLKLYHVTDSYVAAHAWFPNQDPKIPVSDITNVLWGNMKNTSGKNWNRLGFFGHVPVQFIGNLSSNDMIFRENICFLDGGVGIEKINNSNLICVGYNEVLQTVEKIIKVEL